MKILPAETYKKFVQILLWVFIWGSSFNLFAQPGGGGIFGVASVKVGDEFNYSFMGSCSNYTWSASKGTIIGSSFGSSVRIKWTQPGTGQVYLSCSGTSYTKSISIGVLLPTPTFTVSNNCGSSLLVRQQPPSGVTFYWQTGESGTSTGNSALSRTVTSSGTYYLRARSNATGQWGTASSQSVSPMPVPGVPATPSMSYGCGSTSITKPANTSNISYYWQTSSTGTSTNSSNPYVVSQSGTYYLRARSSEGCWSSARSFTVTVNQIPAQPPVLTEQRVCGQSVLSRTSPPQGVIYYWQTSENGTSTSDNSPNYSIVNPGYQTIYLRSRSAQGCWGPSRAYTANVMAIPTAPINAINDHRFGEGTISPSVESNATEFRWYTQSSGGQAIAGVSGKMYTHNPSVTTTYYVATVNQDGCESSRIAVTAYRHPAVVINSSDDLVLETGGTITLSTNSFDTYQWMRDGRPIGTSPILNVTWPGEYWLKVTKSGAAAESEHIYVDRARDVFPFRERQHTVVTSIKMGGVKTADISTVAEDDLQHLIQYTDGLGRVLQTVSHKASPDGGDIVQPFAYNQYGLSPKQYLPYVSQTADGRFKADALADNSYQESAQYQFYQSAEGVAHDTKPYAEVNYETSPYHSVKEQAAVGTSWQLGQRSNSSKWKLNTTGDAVRAWKISTVTGRPESTHAYPAGALRVSITKNADQQVSKTYTDMNGRTVLMRQLSSDGTKELETYTVFDAFGRPILVFPPEAVARMHAANSYVPNTAFLNSWTTQYQYDKRHRTIGQKVPENDWYFAVYDRWNRPVLIQDGNRRQAGEWLFIKYDMLNRRIMTGVYTNAQSRESLQAEVDAFYSSSPELRGEEKGSSVHGYTNRSFPANVTEENVFKINYFEDYSFVPAASNHLSYTAELGNPATPIAQLSGLATGSKVRIMDEETWLWQALYYDEDYRLIQGIAENHLGGSDRYSIRYDFLGKMMESLHIHTANGAEFRIRENYTYDANERLLSVHHQVNDETPVLLSSLQYNALGQVKEKKLHSEDLGNNFLQSLAYRYNIRGWLLSINGDEVEGGTGLGTDRFFSMELAYEQPLADGIAQTPSYTGNISATAWKNKGLGLEKSKAYSYIYDDFNRLKDAHHYEKEATWASTQALTVEDILYDGNGNIQQLSRKGANGQQVDLLNFDYGSEGNRLQKVDDNSGQDHGFKDGTNSGADYDYDANGNMLEDKNKGIVNIVYNALNLPVEVHFDDGRELRYRYDANGTKLGQYSYDASGALQDAMENVNMFVYQQDTLQYVHHGEGRYLPGKKEYQYHLLDHQGNVRLTVSANPGINAATATFEAADAPSGQANFLHYDKVTKVNADLFDHTKSGDSRYSMRLSGSEKEKTGLVKTIAVMPGDKVKAEVFAKYVDPDQNNWSQALIALMANIAGGGSTIVTEGTGPAAQLPYPAPVSHVGNDPGGPQAYLNVLVFDRDFNLLDIAYKQVSEAAREQGAGGNHEHLAREVEITQPGYVYVYLSNDGAVPIDLFFDDFTVVHEEGPLVQADDYYPYGMQAMHFSRDSSPFNRYLYNEGSELNPQTALYETPFRQYDAALGRFTGTDLLAGAYSGISPYHYGSNNPVRYNDPMGLQPEEPLAMSNAREGCGFCPIGGAAGGGSIGNSWIEQYRSPETNLAYMSTSGFSSFYGIDGMSGSELADFATGSGLGSYVPAAYYTTFFAAIGSGERQLGSATVGGQYHFYHVDGSGNFYIPYTDTQVEPSVYFAGNRPDPNAGVGLSGNDGYVPFWGAGRDAVYWAQHGDYSRAAFNGAMAMSDVFLIRAVGAAALKGGAKALANGGGRTFAQYKAARGGTQTLEFVKTTNAAGLSVQQRISTEFHHVLITQRMQKAYNLPNLLVNNRLNVWKLNTIQHSIVDGYRFNFLRAGLKPQVGLFKQYNWFTKFGN